MTNPFDTIQRNTAPAPVNPFDDIGGVNPFDDEPPPSSRAPVPDVAGDRGLATLPQRYGAAIKEIVTNPVDAIKGMAKSVLLDAMRATVSPIKGLEAFTTPPEFIQRLIPGSGESVTPSQLGGATLRTVTNFGLPAARSFGAAAGIGAAAGALQSPDDPLLGTALGATLGPAFHGAAKTVGAGARELGRAAGLKKVAKTGAPLPESKLPAQPEPPPAPAKTAIRDLTNTEVLDMTPEGIKIMARQAAKEERALYSELFGPKGARRYRGALRRSVSSQESPEAAAKALATLQAMRSGLTTAQQTALDEVSARGFTSKRLSTIAAATKDYTPELLGKIDTESLTRQFGEVLMSKRPDRNLSGLYRLRALFRELQGRGVDDTELLKATFNYMTDQGVPTDGLGKLILSKMIDVRKTLAKVDPQRVQPDPGDAPTVGGAGNNLASRLPGDGSTTGILANIRQKGLEQIWRRFADEWQKQSGDADHIVAEASARQVLADYDAAVKSGLSDADAKAKIVADLAKMEADPNIERAQPAVTRRSLEPISEGQFQQELAAITPTPPPPIDETAAARARVEAARTTPFPGQDINPLISSQPEAPLVTAYLAETGGTVQSVLNEFTGGYERNKQGIIRQIANNALQRSGEIGGDPPYAAVEAELTKLAGQVTPSTNVPAAVEKVKQFAKDESGYLDLDALIDPLQTKPDVSKLAPHSKKIQDQIEVGYNPENPNPMRPIEGLYAALVRRVAPIEKRIKAVEKATGAKTRVADSPAAAIQLLSGWAGKAQHFLEYGGFREVGGQIVPTGNKGLEQIFRESGDLNAFRRLAIAQRVAELDAQGRKVETGIAVPDALQEVASANPRTAAAVAEMHKYLDGVLQYATDADLLDPATTQYLRQLGQAYVPLDRVLKKGTPQISNVQYSALSTPQQFRSLVGSKLKIVDPLYSTVDYTRRIIRASELNKVGRSLVEFTKAHPNETKGWLIRQKNVSATNAPNVVATGQGIQQIAKKLGINIDLNTAKQVGALLSDSNLLVEGDIMRVREGGEVFQYKVDPVIGKILRSLGPQELQLWERLIGAPSQILRTGVTQNPVFGAFQAFVGMFQSKIQSQYGFRITQDPFIGLYNRLTKSPAYREALAAGGTSAFLSATGRSTESALRSVVKGSPAQRAFTNIAHPIELLRKISEPLEEMNRLGEYIRARKQGADVLEAALAMREVDTDFSMIGTQMAAFSHMIAFANPFLQGMDKWARTLKNNPRSAVANAAMAVTAPSVLLWIAASGDKEVRDLQRSEQGTRNWFTRLPGGKIAKIPKPYVWGEVFGTTAEAVLNQLETGDPDQYSTLAKGITDMMSFLFLPTAAQTIVGALGNVDPMNNWSPIVPESRAGVEPGLQSTNTTSETARTIGEYINVSPAKIDFAIRSLGGTLAREGTRFTDVLIPDGPATPPAPVSADLPLIGRFFGRYPSQSVEPIRTFYKDATETATKLNTVRAYIDQMKPEKARQYAEKHRELLGLADAYGKMRQDFAEKRGLMEKIRDVPDDVMTPQTKRELTDQVMTAMIEQARALNEAVRLRRREAKASQRQLETVQ